MTFRANKLRITVGYFIQHCFELILWRDRYSYVKFPRDITDVPDCVA